MLPDGASIAEVVLDLGVLAKARESAVHVVCSTLSIAFAEELAARPGKTPLLIGGVAAAHQTMPSSARRGIEARSGSF